MNASARSEKWTSLIGLISGALPLVKEVFLHNLGSNLSIYNATRNP
jgi:hypothetical protein